MRPAAASSGAAVGGLDGDAVDDKSRSLDGVDVCELVVPVAGAAGRFVGGGWSPPALSLNDGEPQTNRVREFIGSVIFQQMRKRPVVNASPCSEYSIIRNGQSGLSVTSHVFFTYTLLYQTVQTDCHKNAAHINESFLGLYRSILRSYNGGLAIKPTRLNRGLQM